MFKISIEPWDSRVSPSICSLLKAQKGEQSKILKPRNFSPELPNPQSVRCFQTLPGPAGAPGTVCKSEVTSFNPMPPFKQDRSSGNGFCPQQILQFFYSCTKLQYTDRILFDTIEAWFREILMLKPILALYERRSKHDISLHPSPWFSLQYIFSDYQRTCCISLRILPLGKIQYLGFCPEEVFPKFAEHHCKFHQSSILRNTKFNINICV